MILLTRRRSPTHAAGLLLAILATSLLLACGVQGPTRPPRVQQPERVTDLSVSQRGHTLEIEFSLPQLATDGERLTKPVEAQILRATFPIAPSATTATGAFTVWRSLLPADVRKQAAGEKVELSVPLADEEFRALRQSTLSFGIRTLTRGFRGRAVVSELSNVVHLWLLDVADAVRGLQARATERAIELTWIPPAQPVSGYRLYRSSTGDPDSFAMLSQPEKASYSDAAFEFGQAYFYKVAAISREGPTVAASEDSETIEFTPQDTFPPAAPQGLTALYTRDVVELIWHANDEPDLAGYNVYRHAEAEPERQINSEPVRTPVYRDRAVAAGMEYVYRVTAFDLAGNESSPSEEAVAETQ